MRASPKGSGIVAFLSLVAAFLVPRVATAGKSTVLASVEASLERCRSSVSQHRSTLTTCTEAKQPSPCVCMCPTCLPEEFPHRKKPPLCTTPKPPPAPPKAPPPPPAPTGPPPPPMKAMKVLPPMYYRHLPTLGPFPPTAYPTTTTLVPPPPPAGKCINDGIYRGSGTYEELGAGLCVDEGDVAISFKKRRELTELNFGCVCKEACDSEPGCIGYSSNANDEGNGLACRVYGWNFPTLVDRWLDLDSMQSPRHKGKKIVGANGKTGMTCYRRKMPGNFVQVRRTQHLVPPPPPQVSFVVRESSTADLLDWQREQLTRCRAQEASLASLLEQKGCRSSAISGLRRQGRTSRELVMPNECECHCPDCNFWQLPPPICYEPVPPPTSTMQPLPPGVMVVTGAPRPMTPPPLPVQIPLPPLPPIGDQFLPTLAPLTEPPP